MTLDAELELAEHRFATTRAGFDATGQFANYLAVELTDDEHARTLLAGVMRAVDAVGAALERGDAARAHRLLDRLDARCDELAGYCLERQAELFPAEAEQLEVEHEQRLDDLARSGPAAAAVVRDRRRSFAAARQRFVDAPVRSGRDLVRTLVGQVRERAARARSSPGRDAPSSDGSHARPRPPDDDDDPDGLAAPKAAA